MPDILGQSLCNAACNTSRAASFTNGLHGAAHRDILPDGRHRQGRHRAPADRAARTILPRIVGSMVAALEQRDNALRAAA